MKPRLEQVLGQRLRDVAAERGLPLSHVADRAGIARSHFWLLLDGEVSTSLGVVQKIAEVLDVDPVSLLVATDRPVGTTSRTRTVATQPFAANPTKKPKRRKRG